MVVVIDGMVMGNSPEGEILNAAMNYNKLINVYQNLRLDHLAKGDVYESDDNVRNFISFGIRRFMYFIDALMNDESANPNSMTFPIDILFAWNVFLLNPKAYNTFLKSHGFEKFLMVPFPLNNLARFMTQDLNYYPSQGVYEFEGFMNKYYTEKKLGRFAFTETEFDQTIVFCPSCSEFFYTQFNDVCIPKFSVSEKCGCGYEVNHANLRWVKLKSDCESGFLSSNNFSDVNATNIANIKKLVLDSPIQDINTFISSNKSMLSTSEISILVAYLKFNPHQLIPGFAIMEDLIPSAFRYTRFCDKFFELELIANPFAAMTYMKAQQKYFKFTQLFGRDVVPTLEVEFIWQVYKLNHYQYIRNGIYDYDVMDGNKLIDCFKNTCSLYKARFSEDFSECPCKICSTTRTKSSSLKSKFKMTKLLKIPGTQEIIATPRDAERYSNSHIDFQKSVKYNTTQLLGYEWEGDLNQFPPTLNPVIKMG